MTDYFRKKAHTYELITTFDDVLLIPGFTNFNPNEVDISTILGEKYKFNLPIMSAAMDTVTEEEMAIKMALLGGLGVLHRNCSFEKQLKMVRHVKRARSFIIEDVATISPEEPLYKAKNFLENYGISGLVVVDDENKVCGIFTKRDIPFSEEECKKGLIKDFMTKDVISIKPGASREDALEMLFRHRIEKLPIIDNGNLQGLITKKDLKPEFPLAAIDEEGRLLCALAISPKYPTTSEAVSQLKELDQYTDLFFIDVADFYKKDDKILTKKMTRCEEKKI